MAIETPRPSCCYVSLPTYDEKLLNAVIETPINSRAKYAYDLKTGLFKLKQVLPAGMVFPYNFGFLPSTKGQDGDPLDILVLMDAEANPGSLLPSRLIGVIEAEQSEKDGAQERNDRLIAVAQHCSLYGEIEDLSALSKQLLEQIEYFFIAYNKLCGKKFKPLGRYGPGRAARLIKDGMNRFEQEGLEPSES